MFMHIYMHIYICMYMCMCVYVCACTSTLICCIILVLSLFSHLVFRIFAQNYVRKKQEGLNSLHMSSKLEAVASRLDGAYRSHQVG